MQLLQLLCLVAPSHLCQEAKEMKLSPEYVKNLQQHKDILASVRAYRLQTGFTATLKSRSAHSFLGSAESLLSLNTGDFLHLFLVAQMHVVNDPKLVENTILKTRRLRARALFELLENFGFCYVIRTHSEEEPDLVPLFFLNPGDKRNSRTGFAFFRQDKWFFVWAQLPSKTFFVSTGIDKNDLWANKVVVTKAPDRLSETSILTQHISYKQMAAVAFDFRLVLQSGSDRATMRPPPLSLLPRGGGSRPPSPSGGSRPPSPWTTPKRRSFMADKDRGGSSRSSSSGSSRGHSRSPRRRRGRSRTRR